MKLLIGLGNIGDKYCFTRHNVGFMVVDKIALENNLPFKEDKKLKSFITKFRYNNEDVILAKPTTFMNLSGEAAIAIMNYYKIDIKDVLNDVENILNGTYDNIDEIKFRYIGKYNG